MMCEVLRIWTSRRWFALQFKSGAIPLSAGGGEAKSMHTMVDQLSYLQLRLHLTLGSYTGIQHVAPVGSEKKKAFAP